MARFTSKVGNTLPKNSKKILNRIGSIRKVPVSALNLGKSRIPQTTPKGSYTARTSVLTAKNDPITDDLVSYMKTVDNPHEEQLSVYDFFLNARLEDERKAAIKAEKENPERIFSPSRSASLKSHLQRTESAGSVSSGLSNGSTNTQSIAPSTPNSEKDLKKSGSSTPSTPSTPKMDFVVHPSTVIPSPSVTRYTSVYKKCKTPNSILKLKTVAIKTGSPIGKLISANPAEFAPGSAPGSPWEFFQTPPKCYCEPTAKIEWAQMPNPPGFVEKVQKQVSMIHSCAEEADIPSVEHEEQMISKHPKLADIYQNSESKMSDSLGMAENDLKELEQA